MSGQGRHDSRSESSEAKRASVDESLRLSRERVETIIENRIQALVEASPDAIVIIRPSGEITLVNSQAEKMFGYSTEEAIGRSGVEWIDPEYRDIVVNNMLSGYEEPYEARGLRKDGATFPCEIQGKMIQHGKRPIRVTALRDITVRKQAEKALLESEHKFWTLIESMNEAFGIQDKDGFITYANKKQAKNHRLVRIRVPLLIFIENPAEFIQPVFLNGLSYFSHEFTIIVKIMDGIQTVSQQLLCHEKMAQVGP